MSFGGLLQMCRKKKGLSLRTMAKELDISPTFLSDIENDRRLPPTSEKNHNMINEIIRILELNDAESEELKLEADRTLNERGMVAKDFGEYMSKAPKAQVAMRKSSDKNVADKKWEEIIRILEED